MTDLFNILREAILNGSPFIFLIAFFLAALVEFGIPDFFLIDATLLYASYQLDILSPQVLFIILSLLAGRLFGASIVFVLSRYFGERFNLWFKKRFPAQSKRLLSVEGTLDKYTIAGIVFLRLGPGLITAASILAGAACVTSSRFLLGILISSLVADGSRLVVSFLTKHGFAFFGITPSPWEVALAMLLLLALVLGVFYLANRWHSRRQKRRMDQ